MTMAPERTHNVSLFENTKLGRFEKVVSMPNLRTWYGGLTLLIIIKYIF